MPFFEGVEKNVSINIFIYAVKTQVGACKSFSLCSIHMGVAIRGCGRKQFVTMRCAYSTTIGNQDSNPHTFPDTSAACNLPVVALRNWKIFAYLAESAVPLQYVYA